MDDQPNSESNTNMVTPTHPSLIDSSSSESSSSHPPSSEPHITNGNHVSPTKTRNNENRKEKKHKILFLDAYDSFSNNITSLLTTLLDDVDVYVLSIDSPLLNPASPDFGQRFRRELAQYTAVVCGPGPGSPDNDADVGLMNYVWQLQLDAAEKGSNGGEGGLLPVLGICLGFQSLVKYGGGEVKRLKRGLHGMVREVLHRPDANGGDGNIFRDVKPFKATLYHSLCGDIGQHEVSEADWREGGTKWKPIKGCADLLPLAWVEEERDDGEVERILMGVKHLRKPFWGLQYHPESVCTEQEGNKVIENWFKEALRWNEARGRVVMEVGEGERLAHQATKPSLLSRLQVPVGDEQTTLSTTTTTSERKIWWERMGTRPEHRSATVRLPHGVQVSDVVEELGLDGSDKVVVLESANATATASARADVRGRYSIIAAGLEEALRLEYHTGDEYATFKLQKVNGLQVDLSERVFLGPYGGIWGLVASFQEMRSLGGGVELPDLPFLGGFMGFITYEQGLSDIDIHLENRQHHRPDVCLAWVTKSVVIDHTLGLAHIQELYSSDTDLDDDAWMRSTADRLLSTSAHHQHQFLNNLPSPAKKAKTRRPSTSTSIQTPLTKEYEARVKTCQEFIAAGDSYELCLTDQTKITRPLSDMIPSATSQEHHAPQQQRPTSPTFNRKQQQRRRSSSLVPTTTSTPVPSSWHLYKTLRSRQPAPFASYLRLGGATLVSASPERFLTYDRHGRCSMRPMKGTVRKSEAVSTLEQAEKILHVPKEEAENLMIVDLVRHDLHSICGAGNVEVSDLLKVEEYQSVFQMITVVEGQLPSPSSDNKKKYTGLDVLAASLPPGSMTGAPKKRSCELLQQIEQHRERSLYSGVVGYMCVSGRGDWSVTIRSLFRWDDERVTVQVQGEDGQSEEEHEVWHIGAGGAVTILSTPEGEREEMFTKLAGPLRVFADLG
ncbi:ADC synthase [Neurospora tetraspora]|uniref:aminodeoxychorismate synthase n=1 Tax=Neurospora tetraspora TaxID=94610 RepID=A0AAE0JL06_9PEZI|nr:ADC synthase [Neurospora tetraspora]